MASAVTNQLPRWRNLSWFCLDFFSLVQTKTVGHIIYHITFLLYGICKGPFRTFFVNNYLQHFKFSTLSVILVTLNFDVTWVVVFGN